MASDQTRLRINIEGDNTNFRKSLNDTKQQVNNFTQSPGFLQMAGAFGLGGMARSLGSNQRFNAAMEQFRNARADLGRARQQAGGSMAAMMGNITGRQRGGDPIANAYRTMTVRGGLKNMISAGGGAFTSLIAGAATAALPAMVTSIVAAATAITYKVFKNVQAFAEGSREFSGPVMMHQAMLEVTKLRKQIAAAQTPEFVEQQKQYLNAMERLTMMGVDEKTGTSGLINALTETTNAFTRWFSFLENYGPAGLTVPGVIYSTFVAEDKPI